MVSPQRHQPRLSEAQKISASKSVPSQEGLPSWTLDCGQHYECHGAQPANHLCPVREFCPF